MMRRALNIDETSYGCDHPNVARDLNNLARLLQDRDNLEEAEPLMRRHIEILLRFKAVNGRDHPNLRFAFENYRVLLTQMKYTPEQIQTRLDKMAARYKLGIDESAV